MCCDTDACANQLQKVFWSPSKLSAALWDQALYLSQVMVWELQRNPIGPLALLRPC